MSQLLARIESPADLHRLTDADLDQLTQEIRDELVRVLTTRPAHFSSNLGVVELCLALHLSYDFRFDRRTCLVAGNERLGITEDLLVHLDATVEIPMYGLPYSHNVATATAIAIYEYCRQFPRG